MNWALKRGILALLILAGSVPAFAAADYTRPLSACVGQELSDRFSLTETHFAEQQRMLNDTLTKRFPGLEPMVRDPDAFYEKMAARFEAQKKLTPDNPFQFEYNEFGLPVLKMIQGKIGEKLAELKSKRAKLERRVFFKNRKTKAEYDAGIAYYEDLGQEVGARLAAGKVSYIDSIKLSASFSRISGAFDSKKEGLFLRRYMRIDRNIEGYWPKTAQEEYRIYREGKFSLFQVSLDPKEGFWISEKSYVDAFGDKNKLGTLLIPTSEALDCDILMRLMSRDKINLIGVTGDPILADGFPRPSGDFWYHDLRHESAKFHNKQVYLQENGITPDQVPRLNNKLDSWYLEFEKAVAEIPDKNLRAAVEMLSFSFYLDRGLPFAPSRYPNDRPGALHVAKWLGVGLIVGRQGMDFKNPVRSIRAADRWMNDYWIKKLPEETAFLASLKRPSP